MKLLGHFVDEVLVAKGLARIYTSAESEECVAFLRRVGARLTILAVQDMSPVPVPGPLPPTHVQYSGRVLSCYMRNGAGPNVLLGAPDNPGAQGIAFHIGDRRPETIASQALVDLNEAIRLHPDSSDAHHCRGRVYNDRGAYRLALADFDRALALEPDDPWQHNQLAWVLVTAALLSSAALAQTTVATGSIVGTVTDASGAVVPGAKVTIVGSTGQTIKTTTGDQGGYSSGSLVPGVYTVRIEDVLPSQRVAIHVSTRQWVNAWVSPIDAKIIRLAAAIADEIGLERSDESVYLAETTFDSRDERDSIRREL